MLVKPNCTPGVVYPPDPSVHDAYMSKGPTKRQIVKTRLRPVYQRTFIREWREYRGLTQEQLADAVGKYLLDRGIKGTGYTHASIGRMERGLIPYGQAVMEGISDALRVSVQKLIAVRPPKQGDPEPPDPEDLMRLWEQFSKMRGTS